MLCGGLVVCLHDVGKEASDPRPLGTNLEFFIVSLDLRIMGSRPCYVFGSKCAYITMTFKLSDPFFSGVYYMYTREDMFDTLYLIMMAAFNMVGSRLIPL